MAEALRLASDEGQLISRAEIAWRVGELGLHYSERFSKFGEVLIIAVMNGAVTFAPSLMGAINHPRIVYSSVRVLYRDDTKTPGAPSVLTNLEIYPKRCHVLLIDGLQNSRKTISEVSSRIADCEPTSLDVVTLLDNPTRHEEHPIQADSVEVGFPIADVRPVGYGLDHDGLFRDLQFVTTYAFDKEGNPYPVVASEDEPALRAG